MENKMQKKYGLFTAMSMVIGMVIGSGVFFKAEKVLNATGGNLKIGILSWIIGGIIMVLCAINFATLATKYSKVNGIVDYAEFALGEKYGFFVGWFMTTIYYPTLTSVISWIAAKFIGGLFGLASNSLAVMLITLAIIICIYAINVLSPILSGKFQVSTTVIKLIPLIGMAIVGTIVGLSNGMTVQNFTTVVDSTIPTGKALFTAVVATAFAYEGWIIATSINAELKDAKKNLPLALIFGGFTVVAVYILYYIGLAGSITNAELMALGEGGVRQAFSSIFGNIAGTALMVFVAISCIGTANGFMLGITRGMYSLAVRDMGPKPQLFKQVNEKTNMPVQTSVFGLILVILWGVYFYGANLAPNPWFGLFCFDSSELPIVTIYATYIPIFIMMMKKEKDLSTVKRFVLPACGLVSCTVMIVASIVSHGMANLFYLVVFAVIMAIGMLLRKPKQK